MSKPLSAAAPIGKRVGGWAGGGASSAILLCFGVADFRCSSVFICWLLDGVELVEETFLILHKSRCCDFEIPRPPGLRPRSPSAGI